MLQKEFGTWDFTVCITCIDGILSSVLKKASFAVLS